MSHMVDRPDGAALLAKACDVLDAVAASPGGASQAEVAARTGLPRTTLYRILAVLAARGLLRQDPARRAWALGFRVLEMAHAVGSPELPAAAAPELRALRDATGETAYVAMLEGTEVVALGKFEGAHEQRSAARLGVRKPLHCTSQGKAILAFLPEAERDALLRGLPLPALTPLTITEPRRLLAALRIIRARGFATDDEEIAPGVRCVGAPVLDARGVVRGAISIAGPAFRMTRARLELLGPEVAAAGRRIGAALRPPPAEATGAAEALPGPAAFRGIGPRRGAAGLWWADALAPEIRLLGAEARVAAWEAPVIALLPAREGGALVLDDAGQAALLAADGAVARRRRLPPLLAARAAPDGTPWGAQALPGEGGSAIGPLRADGVQPAWRLPGRVAALAFAADGVAFAAVPEAGAVFRLEPGRARVWLLARLPAGSGRPAGLAVDAEGAPWLALEGGWAVARLGPEGEVERLLPLPVPAPTDLCFDGTRLLVATARAGVALDVLAQAPLSGRLLALAPGVAGAPEAAVRWR